MDSSNPQRIRLVRVLAAFFVLLALPTGAVIWQAFDQLKFESYFQYRNQAETLSSRIDTRLLRISREADARGFSDYAFLNVTDPANTNLLQRSPLAAYPVSDSTPGAVGYFQVDAEGRFSTPLLPAEHLLEPLGIAVDEYLARRDLANELRRILADNRLVSPQQPASSPLEVVGSSDSTTPSLTTPPAAEDTAVTAAGAASSMRSVEQGTYTQQSFDDLLAEQERDSGQKTGRENERADTALVDALEIDESLEKKSAVFDQRQTNLAAESSAPPQRARRKEQASLPEQSEETALTDEDEPAGVQRILTFESEIDPYYFRALDSGHFVMFRNVWREGERYVQGVLIDQPTFVTDVVSTEYQGAGLASVAKLEIGYYGQTLAELSTNGASTYSADSGALRGTHLYSRQLSAPFDGLALVFSVETLPLGPGSRVLAWTTIALAAVFVLGFVALYRLGTGQIRLAQQRQDFVSAVSHELKTPLTSIRMYGEMLNEGWVDDTRRKRYYRFIHDEAERLTRLISNVLRLAKISRDDRKLNLARISVAELIDTIESKVTQQADRAGFRLRTNVPDTMRTVHVLVDSDAIIQVFINLIDNAVKFSNHAEKKTIDVSVATTGENKVLLSVRDYGPGIPKTQLKRIFTLFYRSESELTRETVGTGIGLAIVHELVSEMNGRVDVVNTDPGAEFRLFLPRNETP